MHVCVEAEDSLGAAFQERLFSYLVSYLQGFWILNSLCMQQALTQLFSKPQIVSTIINSFRNQRIPF